MLSLLTEANINEQYPLFLTLQKHFNLIHPHLFYHCAFFSKSRFDLHAVKFSFIMCVSVAFSIFLKCKHSTMVPFWVVCMTATVMLPTFLPSIAHVPSSQTVAEP